MRRQLSGALALATSAVLVAALSPASPTQAAPDDPRPLTPAERAALDAGVQVAPKAGTTKRLRAPGPNPYLANLPSAKDADYSTWRTIMERGAAERAQSAAVRSARQRSFGQAALPPAVVHDEEEPAGSTGSNDTHPDAEPVPVFGTARSRNPRVRILGELAETDSVTPRTIETAPEDNGSIPLATDSGLAGVDAVTTTSVLGDGPHGPDGTGSNDFDAISLDATAGVTISADTEGTPTGLDTVLALYDADGTLLAADDDGGTGFLSSLTYTPDADGTVSLFVLGYSSAGPLPADPSDSGSGAGGADTGDYRVTVSAQRFDTDYFALRLRPGDVLGSVGRGSATGLTVRTPGGEQRVGGELTDASFIYPPTSPLPGGGNTAIAYVAEEAGWYSVQVTGETGAYDVLVEGHRPGTQRDRGRRQTVLLDFDPGRVNTGTWGGPGAREVTPFRSFVPLWDIPRAQARRLENRTLNVVRRNIQAEVEAAGLNPAVNVEVLNARTNQDLIGQENVSRIYVAGTIAETGLSTIGVAQYIDPGNYGHEDEAIVLLDSLSSDDGAAFSLNTYMDGSSDRFRFVSNAVGNVIAHEIGHTTGSFHTDNANELGHLMDSGGANFGENLYGIGPDGVGGTDDDVNVRFLTDTYTPAEGFTGLEDTTNVSAWAYAGR